MGFAAVPAPDGRVVVSAAMGAVEDVSTATPLASLYDIARGSSCYGPVARMYTSGISAGDAEAASWATDLDLMRGNGTFRADRQITRGESAVLPERVHRSR